MQGAGGAGGMLAIVIGGKQLTEVLSEMTLAGGVCGAARWVRCPHLGATTVKSVGFLRRCVETT